MISLSLSSKRGPYLYAEISLYLSLQRPLTSLYLSFFLSLRRGPFSLSLQRGPLSQSQSLYFSLQIGPLYHYLSLFPDGSFISFFRSSSLSRGALYLIISSSLSRPFIQRKFSFIHAFISISLSFFFSLQRGPSSLSLWKGPGHSENTVFFKLFFLFCSQSKIKHILFIFFGEGGDVFGYRDTKWRLNMALLVQKFVGN